MAHSLNLDKFMKDHGYTQDKKHIEAKGEVGTVREDYDVWLKVDVRKRILGIQVDRKWKWFHLGKLYSIKTKTVRKVYKTKEVGGGTTAKYFDSTIRDRLGGEEQKLGL